LSDSQLTNDWKAGRQAGRLADRQAGAHLRESAAAAVLRGRRAARPHGAR
jgi:hypothetical protein